MGIVVGIDLGTTNSAISILRKGKPEIVENEIGERTTPSVVCILDTGEIVVGSNAMAFNNSGQYMAKEVKRSMGTETKIEMGGTSYLPQEISAFILKYLKDSVESRFGERVDEVIITVPAAFKDLERKATMDACELAGLKVERIINEPTAAALAYGIENFENEENILVYDLGGGTFDVTILELFDGIFDVKSSEGDTNLGGSNFDEILLEYVLSSLDKDISKHLNNKFLKESLKTEAEKIKKELSFKTMSRVNIPFIPGVADDKGNPISINMSITRSEFERLIDKFVDKTEEIIDLALKNAKMSIDSIHNVLVIGGSTRIPLVKNLLENKFGSKVNYSMNPDEAVALGAAVQGGIKSGVYEDNLDFIITDVCPETHGVEITIKEDDMWITGVYDPLILKNTTIPVSSTKVYSTMSNDQDSVIVKVYQGQEKLAEKNELIGLLTVEGIPEGPAGSQEIEVEYNYDINGRLMVNVIVLSTGEKTTQVYNGVGMSEKEKLESSSKINRDWKKSKLFSKVSALIESTERKMKELSEEEQYEITKLIEKMKSAIINKDEGLVEDTEDQLTDLLFRYMEL